MGAGDKSPLPFYFDNRAHMDFSPPRQSSHFSQKYPLHYLTFSVIIITLIYLI